MAELHFCGQRLASGNRLANRLPLGALAADGRLRASTAGLPTCGKSGDITASRGMRMRLARRGAVRFPLRAGWLAGPAARTILLYALALALTAFGLTWLEYHYVARTFSTEIYIALLAIGFVALGIWAGVKLTPRRAPAEPFQRNHAAIRSLGISPRELEIVEALATGESNKEMARRLGISPNTIKTHVARVYEKLEVQKRVQAIEKARFLGVIP
jgi:DNA-binding CsgD family transcriptional regulator